MPAQNVFHAGSTYSDRGCATTFVASNRKVGRVLPALTALFALAMTVDGLASPPQRAKASLATISNSDSGATYCGESGRYSSLTEAREAMLQFVGKARRCDAVAVGEWRPAGTGAGYSPGGACYGKAFEQTYALCGNGALLRFVFFELPSETDSPVESSNRLSTVDVPSIRIEAAAAKVVANRNSSATTPSVQGLPKRVVLVNAAQSAVMGR